MSDDREMSVAASIASVTVAMFNARHHALMRGETDDSLAKRIGVRLTSSVPFKKTRGPLSRLYSLGRQRLERVVSP